jgi:dipeptidyl aminopeptidase/acylaminoacyl peptidase
MYTALRYLGKRAKLVLYMEGSHSFRSLARPEIRRRRLRDMVEWFNQYMK